MFCGKCIPFPQKERRVILTICSCSMHQQLLFASTAACSCVSVLCLCLWKPHFNTSQCYLLNTSHFQKKERRINRLISKVAVNHPSVNHPFIYSYMLVSIYLCTCRSVTLRWHTRDGECLNVSRIHPTMMTHANPRITFRKSKNSFF